MTNSRTASTAPRRRRLRRMRLAVVLVVGAISAALGHHLLGSSPSPASLASQAASHLHVGRREHGGVGSGHHGPLGEADGAVPDGTTVFDDEVAGVARLDPALLGALRRAATDAARDGVAFVVNSGWRSAAYEDELRREAIVKYGSEAAAARWVATGTTSAHVSGNAVDIGPAGAAGWLSAYGAAYGLCQIYGNEPWHYELRPEAVAHGCPPMYPDPTQDPRMQR